MKYWVVSPNLGAPGEKNLAAWCKFIRLRRVAVMGWGDDNRFGKCFKDDVEMGDLILVASRSNANKQLCIAGIVSSNAEYDLNENAPTYYTSFRRLEPSIELKDEPSENGLSFVGAAHGNAQQIPAIYQLKPFSNPIDKAIVDKLLDLLGHNVTNVDCIDQNDEIANLIAEFKRTYMDAGEGEYHRKLLLQGREQGKKNFENALQLQLAGRDITDAVLYGLLPHADTQNNRENNHWVHVAPSITKDIKEWFEGAGWAQSTEWHDIAEKLFEFIKNAVNTPDKFKEQCANFDAKFQYKGFQVGILSPILNVLSPEHYFVVNIKPVTVINWLVGTQYKPRIKDMPEIVNTIRYWVNENRALLDPITPKDLSVYDTFDIFCHWLKTVKKYPNIDNRYKRYGRGNSDAAAQVLKKIFPDDEIRKTVEEFFIECIMRAHQKNSNSWEITLGPRYVMFNVGFVKVLRLHLRETRIYLLGSAFLPALREKYADIITFSTDHFKSLKEEVGICTISPSKIVEVVNDLKHAVFQFIDTNAVRAKSSAWAASHSPGVLDYLRQSSYKDIPSPDYEGLVVEEVDADEEEVEQDKELSEYKLNPDKFSLNSVKEDNSATVENTNYWWLNVNPMVWGNLAPSIGTQENCTSHNSQGNKKNVYQYFKEVKPGDLLLICVAAPFRQLVALCIVTQGLCNSASGEAFEYKVIEQFKKPVSLKELMDCGPLNNKHCGLFKLKIEEFETIRAIIDQTNEVVDTTVSLEPEYTLTECVKTTGFTVEKFSYWKKAIERKKQAVFYGPPGTGKTFIAHHLARHIVGGTDGFVDCIQFHPAYTYEEFMQGIRPETNDNGNLHFELKPGRFLDFCAKAQLRNGPCVLIIDEINRANLARVFGELMYLLEYRDKDMPLAGGTRFGIPGNVRIIGTMNTADRSIALVDFALRRRFAFLELAPEYNLLCEFQQKHGFKADGLVNVLRNVNVKINDKNFHLGISFFMIENLAEKLEEIWRMEIETYLEEYFFSQPEVITGFFWDKVKERILL